MKLIGSEKIRSMFDVLRLGVVVRIALGMTLLTVMLVLLVDMTFNLLPNEMERVKAKREVQSFQVASAINSVIVEDYSEQRLPDLLGSILEKNRQIESIGVRHQSGVLIYGTGNHADNWVSPLDKKSTLTNVVILLESGNQDWGSIEILYRNDSNSSKLSFLLSPLSILLLSISTLGFLLYYFFLKRVLYHLDPKSAIPDRVKKAFNVLSEGLLVLDANGRVMLANEAVQKMGPEDGGLLLLWKPIARVEWISSVLGGAENPLWKNAMNQQEPIVGVDATLENFTGGVRHVKINCSAIRDGNGKAKGCLITLSDVTELKELINQINESKEIIEAQNKELQLIAYFDPMTGLLNRRSFFRNVGEVWRELVQNNANVSVLVTDIDKFKTVNDTYGHSVGDTVIQTVAGILGTGIRPGDILCRYGGEEFCIVLPNSASDEAMEIANRLRVKIEQEAAQAIAIPGIRITSSFGVSSAVATSAVDIKSLINSADIGLYEAKEAGRNCARLHMVSPSE